MNDLHQITSSISTIKYRRGLVTKPLPNLVSNQISLLSFELNFFFPCALLPPMIYTLITSSIGTIKYRRGLVTKPLTNFVSNQI